VTDPWNFASEPPVADGGGTVTLIEGSTFCIGDASGQVFPDRAQGLFVRDTRVVSGWRLTIDGTEPKALAVHQDAPYAATCLGRLPPKPGRADSTVLVVRDRYVGNGLRERITVRNTSSEPLVAAVELAVQTDFADLFEVKEGRSHPVDDLAVRIGDGALRISRRRFDHEQAVRIEGSDDPSLGIGGLRWDVAVAGHSTWSATVEVRALFDGAVLSTTFPSADPADGSVSARRLQDWRSTRPHVRTGSAALAGALRRSVEDLGSLRIYDPTHPERPVVAAGAPWFMALFGRDSLLTSWMLLPFDTSLALGTLRTLADHQGRRRDPATEEQPGRILHEIRFGPATQGAYGERTIYFGTADATPLFCMLVGELARWTGLTDDIRDLLPHVDRALAWIVEDGDRDGDGFVEYARSTDEGLVNQGWKDSWDGVNDAAGRIPPAPIALAEVQAYCYGAFVARAALAAADGDTEVASGWTARAEELKRRFNDTFWLPERGWYAIGLDGDKAPIDALTSNIGHCLWTGIADDDKAAAVAAHLTSRDLFTGWGVRTLAESMGAYNPMSYHNGSVWPHDSALCAAGLVRYGFVTEAHALVTGLIEASAHFGHRLPELFCGFGSDEFAIPVGYPSSCSPQAWAAATPVALLRAILRLDPDVPVGRIACAPAVPAALRPLEVSGIRVGGATLTITVDDDGWRVDGSDDAGLTLAGPNSG
jgi:glycogen debranching enzyme